MSRDRFCKAEKKDLDRRLRAWFNVKPGGLLLEQEEALIATMAQHLFGYYLIQLQGFGHRVEALADSPVKHKIMLAGSGNGLDADGYSEAERLAIQTDSVDAVVLPHTLDFSSDPHQVLREVERVLIPEGRVIIIGFNPLSLWGVWRMFGRWQGDVPWCGHFLSYPRIVDWLSLMGFDIEFTDVCAFTPPLRQAGMTGRLQGMESLGKRLWPMLGGVYAVRAVKRVATLRPVKPVWARLGNIGPRAVEPTAREAQDA